MADKVQTVVLGDKAATVAVDQAPIIEKFKADQAKAFSDAEAKHKAEIEAKDAELAKAEAALDAEKAKVLSDADIDKRVADRAALITKATAIVADVKVDGVADADIRKAVVVAKLGDEMAAKPAAYIDARFDILCEDAGDAVADALQTPGVAALDMNKAYADRAAKLNGAWKSGKEA